jgi:serine/threonine-protein kinase
MSGEEDHTEQLNIELAQRFCQSRGWTLIDTAGRGGTAPVFSVETPEGIRALKLYDHEFSAGTRGEESLKRIRLQVEELGQHDCPYIVSVYEGGEFEDRLYVLMEKAVGRELEKILKEIPRSDIRDLIDQVARAALFLRSRNLCHRDIKSANIFYDAESKTAKLLDLSVLRDIEDPIGLGTDHGGQLPVVATSRYSPPEYLFRLIDPGAELWHALDVYQLGGLLHDLIMREPMFEEEYQKTKETNRYRFAWIVATQSPKVEALDVDQDLVVLARRSLDKDWSRRGRIRLDGFLKDQQTVQARSLGIIGLAPRTSKSSGLSLANVLERIDEIAQTLDDELRMFLSKQGVTAIHGTKDRPSNGKAIHLKWTSKVSKDEEIHLEWILELRPDLSAKPPRLMASSQLRAAGAVKKQVTQDMAPVPLEGDTSFAQILEFASVSIGGLAQRLLEVGEGE